MGDLLGIRKQLEADDAVFNQDGDLDYKSGSYSSAMKEKTEGNSEFSLTKTLKEQRDYS